MGYWKNLCILGGITFSRRNFLVSQCRKLLWASLQCFRNFEVLKKFMHNRGYHSFLSKIFCLTAPKNFMGIPSIFQKIWGIEKFHALMGYHNFPSKNFCLTVPKKFVVESYCFGEKFWFQKVLWMKKGVSRFCVQNFWSHSAEKFRGHPFKVSEKLGYWKTLCILGGITFSRRKDLVSQCRKISWASLQSFRKFGISKNFMHLWGITIFRRKFFVSQFRKIS